MIVDWNDINEQLFAMGYHDWGTPIAEAAVKLIDPTKDKRTIEQLEDLIGEDGVRSAVEHCYYDVGFHKVDSARSLLMAFVPMTGMLTCYEIYKTSQNIHRRRAAVSLLCHVSDEHALAWVPEFFLDPDGGIQSSGAYLLDLLVWSELVAPDGTVSPELENILNIGKNHDNEYVRAKTLEAITRINERSKGK